MNPGQGVSATERIGFFLPRMIVGFTIRNCRLSAICALLLACWLCSVALADDASTQKPAPQKSSAASTKSKTHSTSSKKRRKKSTRVRGQQKIDSERTQEIQEALIREHYLDGEPTGTWNEATEAALRRYQADNGWQSKTVPDSRALIKLGLGPSKDHLLNPDSAMTTIPDPPKAERMPTKSHTPQPVSDPASPTTPPATPPSSNSAGPQ